MNELVINLTSIGASHIRAGKECQDFSLSESTETYSMVVVCDGHGGENYFRSAYGSCFAAQAASACISEFMQDFDTTVVPAKPEQLLVQLEKSIIAKWNTSVWEHYESNPFSEEELGSISENRRQRVLSGKSIESTYGTTLIALAWTESFWFGMQIGDGKCVRINKDGTFDQPIPANEKCFLNTTTSICDANAIEDFRHYFSAEMPAAVFCGSDGIDDSFIRDEQLYKLYSTVARSLSENEFDTACTELEDYLPRLSSKGSGDDVSIAGILDKQAVLEVLPEIVIPEQGPEGEVVVASEAAASMSVVTESVEDIHADDADFPLNNLQESANSFVKTDSDTAGAESLAQIENPNGGGCEPESVYENCSQEKLTRPKFCADCGNELDDSCKFCPECGSRVELVQGQVVGESSCR